MTTLVNSSEPYLSILLPGGDYARFVGGRLEVPEDHPDYGHIMDEAVRRPTIAILVNETTCPYCGEVYKGDRAAAKLEAHTKDNHFDLWLKQTELDHAKLVHAEVKARAGYACDVCAPVQTFGNEEGLAEHIALLHTNPEDMDAAGNTTTSETRPGEKVIQRRNEKAAANGVEKPPSEINALRAEAKALGLKGSGTKIELVAAINEHLEAKKAAAEGGTLTEGAPEGPVVAPTVPQDAATSPIERHQPTIDADPPAES